MLVSSAYESFLMYLRVWSIVEDGWQGVHFTASYCGALGFIENFCFWLRSPEGWFHLCHTLLRGDVLQNGTCGVHFVSCIHIPCLGGRHRWWNYCFERLHAIRLFWCSCSIQVLYMLCLWCWKRLHETQYTVHKAPSFKTTDIWFRRLWRLTITLPSFICACTTAVCLSVSASWDAERLCIRIVAVFVTRTIGFTQDVFQCMKWAGGISDSNVEISPRS